MEGYRFGLGVMAAAILVSIFEMVRSFSNPEGGVVSLVDATSPLTMKFIRDNSMISNLVKKADYPAM